MKRVLRFMCFLMVLFYAVNGCAMGISDYSKRQEFQKDKEKVLFDYEQGKWSYESDTMSVDIQRFEDPKYTCIWYIADVKFSEPNKLQHFFADDSNVGRSFKYAENIARDNKVVFGINDDQVGYRIYNHKTVGHVIHQGKIIGNETYKKKVRILPNLDCMAIAEDGTMCVYEFNEHTAEEYLDMGYKMVSSFGPYVIRDGELNPYLENHYTLQEARTVIGMADKNHYVVFTCEGRRKGKSLGASLKWVGERLKEKGVVQAFNLDGGGTTSLLFMGIKLNYFNPTGIVRKDRALNGVFGIGTSDLVPAWEGLGK